MNTEIASIRLNGLVGVFAATLVFLSDCIVMDSSTSGAEIGTVAMERLTESPNWRLFLAGIGGPVGACLFVVGFWHVYLALKPGGQKTAFLCAVGFSAAYIILGAFHAAFPVVAFMNRMQPAFDDPNMRDAMGYIMRIGFVGVVPAIISMLMLPALILFRRSRYPKWFAIVNPGLIFLCTSAFHYAPAPIGGFLVVGAGSLAFLAFFIISTAVLWHGGLSEKQLSRDDSCEFKTITR